jgi:hypothetical protein
VTTQRQCHNTHNVLVELVPNFSHFGTV